MAADRDLAVAIVRACGAMRRLPGSGWDVAAATGARGLRLLAESDAFSSMLLTETHPAAFTVLRTNAERHPGAVARNDDARVTPADAPFGYVDVDPYGSPIPFLPAALRSVTRNGLLAVTATDMMVLAGPQPDACLRRYGARPVRGRLAPEGALRILIAYVMRLAHEAGRDLRPAVAYSRDHYVRAYFDLDIAPALGDPPVGEIAPAAWTGPTVGDRGPYGPMWLGPLFRPELVDRLVPPVSAARPRETARFIERLREEVAADVPFYFEPNVVAKELGLASPPSVLALRDGLREAGFRAARTHARPEGVRTDAPRDRVAELARRLAGQSQNARVRA